MLQLRPAPGVPLHHRLVSRRKQYLGVVQAGGHQVPEVRRRQRGEHAETVSPASPPPAGIPASMRRSSAPEKASSFVSRKSMGVPSI